MRRRSFRPQAIDVLRRNAPYKLQMLKGSSLPCEFPVPMDLLSRRFVFARNIEKNLSIYNKR